MKGGGEDVGEDVGVVRCWGGEMLVRMLVRMLGW